MRTNERVRDHHASKPDVYQDVPSGTEGSEYSFRSSTIHNPEVDTRVEAMEAKLAELSKKFDQITSTPSSDEKSEVDRKSLVDLTKLESDNSDLLNRLEINEKSKNELARKYTKCLDRIYDLEKELDRANQQILIKNEQLICIREAASVMFSQFSDLRSEITSARRAQIDMRRSMQNEVQVRVNKNNILNI